MKNGFTTAALIAGLAIGACLPLRAQSAELVGQKTCKMCHNKEAEGQQWHKWKESKHATAYQVLSGDEAKEFAAKAGLSTAPAESPDCLKCHVTGYDAANKTAPAQLAIEDGVQCESCHGPASEHLLYGKAMMKKDADKDAPKKIAIPAAETCLVCHNDESPAWDSKKYTSEDGAASGFLFEQAVAQVAHPNPEKQQQAAGSK